MIDLDKLKKEFYDECDRIAEECEEEGYPPHGENYDLRVTNLMEDPYFHPLWTDDSK